MYICTVLTAPKWKVPTDYSSYVIRGDHWCTFSVWNIWYRSVVVFLIWLHSLVCQIHNKQMSQLVAYSGSICVWVVSCNEHTCQPIQFTSIKYFFFFLIILGGYGHIGKWIQENIIFMRFCCCFKLRKKTEKLSNEQLTHTVAKCTLTGLVQ